ncbi:aldo/keto reductase [Spelaeicoccus albus]|uniref:L-glyceraldehyde 3-phosphate reductase n=1 Tax=Spelaeicoccus albus TaxID=1280376 RepID=A0A7Z0AA82_9MICO|nr:aldo/keto reductase [Spelaeicoccus albus]NYI65938.1 L-glyceraldehyde 3-phosphate reductase [Spelaeicoccus albus]
MPTGHGARFEVVNDDFRAPYVADNSRWAGFSYRRVGNSGLLLPPISLGLWYNFGDNRPFDVQREVLRYAFDHGISHFDLANNYGPPYGSAEENFGRMMAKDFRPYRNEMVISTKAGWDMWTGPYGRLGPRKYLLTSLDESLSRMNLDYVDIFYSHRFDADTPLEETIGALHTAVTSGKAMYAGISSYSAERTAEAKKIADDLGTPLIIHQPAYSMLNRWVEDGLLTTLDDRDMGAIVFTPLAQGLLTGKYLGGADGVARATDRPSIGGDTFTKENLDAVRALNDIATRRGQTLAQLALAWVLRTPTVTSAVIGASSVGQLKENLGALDNTEFTEAELAEIDAATSAAGVGGWEASSEL